ncbi:MAG TPA: AMP-binding protein, partial [Gaiellaceae bacterium]|nr:AMP-binding protein [Gaiellaceae bacterium]
MNLATILAAGDEARPALFLDEAAESYGALRARTDTAAAELRARGVHEGDRVALLLPNGPAFVAALFATWRLGAVAVPLNVLLAPPEIDARVALSGARLVVDDEGLGRGGG